jgi:O-antigen ligase/Flp pilus assembly protein TadD
MKKQKVGKTETRKQERDRYFPLKLAAAFVFFVLAPLVNWKPAYDYTIIKDVFGCLFIILFAIYLLVKKQDIELDAGAVAIGTAFFVWILIGCFYAPVKYGAAASLENYLLYFVLFLAGLMWKWDTSDAYLWTAALMIASIVGIVQFYNPESHYPISTFGNPNFFSGHLLMPIFLTFYFARRKNYYYAGACFLVMTYALAIAHSRASLFGLFVGLIFVFFLFFKERKPVFIRYLGFLVLAGAVLYLLPEIKKEITGDIRFYIWKGTWRMIMVKSWAGWGTGNFIFYYPYFRERTYFLRPQATPITNHPHCQYLEWWVENGAVALILLALLVGYLFFFGFRRDQDKEKHNLTIFIIPAIIAVLLDNVLSTNLTNTSTAMYFWFLLGLLGAFARFPSKVRIAGEFKKALLYAMIFSALVLCGWKIGFRIVPEVYLKNAISAREAADYYAKQGNREAAIESFNVAIENYQKTCKINPYHVVAWYKMAFAYGQVNDLRKAEEIYQKINSLYFPHFAKTDSNLATLYMQFNDTRRAIQYFEIARWFNPYDSEVLTSLAALYLHDGINTDSAVAYLKQALQIDPKNVYALETLKKLGKIDEKISQAAKNRSSQ